MSTRPDSLSWYVIHTNPKQEERAHNNLTAWHVESFSPRIRERRLNRLTGASSFVSKPLFPRYIFARFDPRHLHKIRFTRGVHGVVSFGDRPTPVADEVIEVIQSRVDVDGFVKRGETFAPGDKVQVKDGPLKDLVGIFERETSEADRVMILMVTVSYQARIEIERDYLAKVS
ncbi:MAG TPA: transcription termination/antitermination NusG family protein [Pyrinomonadaceae bacterium]|nr:transcription termination/antitermination NusG family protein [Pyrinomonadaceae bacterium]